jgi:Lrp/AsnC family leucine-responsive transcriptional regulator
MAVETRRNAGITYDPAILDEINRSILRELHADARLPMAELGRRVGLSPPAVAERVQRLEGAGVIAGYHAEINPKAIGYPVSAVVRVRPIAAQLRTIADLARESPEVVECYRITGEDCFLIRLELRSLEDLEEILDRFVPLGQTTTSLIHSAPVEPRLPPIEEE